MAQGIGRARRWPPGPVSTRLRPSRQPRSPARSAPGEETKMPTTVNAGARLDRLPISSFHYRIFWLIAAAMFFDGYDLYVASGVLAGTVQTKFATPPQVFQFISWT